MRKKVWRKCAGNKVTPASFSRCWDGACLAPAPGEMAGIVRLNLPRKCKGCEKRVAAALKTAALSVLLMCALAATVACGTGDPVAPTDAPTSAPVLIAQPQPRVVPVGTSWTFAVEATGGGLKYQWRRNGAAISGATAATFFFQPATLSGGGTFDVVVSNAMGSATSDPVQVRVVSAEGPWMRGLVFATGNGPAQWGPFATFMPRAGVPSLARLPDGRLIAAFQWFPYDDPVAFDQVTVAFSGDEGRTWQNPQPIRITGFPANHQRPFDPTVTVTETGDIRLYYTSGPMTGGLPNPSLGFYSARSSDGVTYQFEPGIRFFPGRSTVDCAAILWRGTWHLISPVGAPQEGAYHAVSQDGLSFERLADIPSDAIANWTGNLVAVGDVLRFYGTSRQGVWYSDSTDGIRWGNPTYLPGIRGGDPAVVEAAPGRWLLVVTE